MGLIGSLIGRLTLEDQSFVVPLRKARKEISDTEKQFTAATNKMKLAGAGLKNIAAGFVGGFAFAGIQQAIQGGLDYASSLGEVAQQLGVTTKTLQEYRYIATQTGVSQEEMDKSLAKLTRSIGEAASGGKAQAAAFGALGVSIRGANGELRPTGDVLRDLTAAFSTIKDPAARARLEMALFGKSGQQLDPLLTQGVKKIDEMREAAHKLGIVLSEDAIAKADETADKLSELNTVLAARISGVVADNATAIYNLANALVSAGGATIKFANDYSAAAGVMGGAALGAIFKGGPGAFVGGGVGLIAALRDKQAGGPEQRMSDAQIIKRVRDLAAKRRQRAAIGNGLSYGGEASAGMDAEYQRLVTIFNTRRQSGSRRLKETPVPGGADPLADFKKAMSSSGGGGRKKPAGAKAKKDTGPTLQEETDRIFDQLFPNQAKQEELTAQAAKLGEALAKGVINKDEFEKARAAIAEETFKLVDSETGTIASVIKPISAWEGWRDEPVLDRMFARVGDALEKNIKPKFEESANAVRDFADAMGRLRSDISGGDFFSIVGSVLDVVVKAKTTFDGFRANGGPVSFGKSYVVGERGPELFVPGASGRIVSNDNINAGREPAVVQLVVGEGQMFEPRVTGISGAVSVRTVGAAQRNAALRASRRY